MSTSTNTSLSINKKNEYDPKLEQEHTQLSQLSEPSWAHLYHNKSRTTQCGELLNKVTKKKRNLKCKFFLSASSLTILLPFRLSLTPLFFYGSHSLMLQL